MGFRRPESDTTKMRGVVAREERCQQTLDGTSFYAYALAGEGSALADNASLEIVFTTGTAKNVYIWIAGSCGGDAEMTVFEDVTEVTGGDLFVPVNRNRQSPTLSTSGVIVGPTSVTTNGAIYSEVYPGGQKSHSGGGGNESQPYVLKANTSYLIQLTNRAGSAKFAEIQLQWCEI
jgi:hypothetical protein